jgi:Radical SAM superfamily
VRVYLADLSYLSDFDTNHPVPLNVGYIGAYLKQHRPGDDIELFKDPRELIRRLTIRPPDVLAMSHYDWNANLNLPILSHAREVKPDVVTVMGGPNFHAKDAGWIADFFSSRPEVDAYITGEGEDSLTRLVGLVDRHGDISGVPWDARPSSVYAFDRGRAEVVHNPNNPVARLDLSTVPSPYLNGMLDRFLHDPRLAPIIETNRGCPYSCAYCCWGQATQSKINSFPLETVLAEIRHAAQTTTNPTGFFYIADGNFGIYERDQDIATALQECTNTIGTPKRVYVYFAKNTNERVLRIAETLSSVTMMSMSKQTLNPVVLDNVRRKNIPVSQYDLLRLECEKRGIPTYSELIYGLAGESEESYINGVIATIREGQLVTMYPQLLLAGAESGEKAYRERFGFKTAFRVIPRYVGSFDDLHSLEYDEIVVEHNDMTREGYWRIRLFQFLVTLFMGQSFQEFNKALARAGLDYGTLAKLVAGDRDRWTPGVTELLDRFLQGARDELIDQKDLKRRFTAEDIVKARANVALVPYISCYLASKRAVVDDLRVYLERLVASDIDGRLKPECRGELSACLAVAFDKLICYDPLVREKTALYDYDFDAWLAAGAREPLDSFRSASPVTCLYQLDPVLEASVEKSKTAGGSLLDALYRVRVNALGKIPGDRLFCYRRMTTAAEQRDRNASISTAHANLAARN